MKTTATLFEESLAQVPDDVRLDLDMFFALADKIYAVLKEKNISQKELAKRMRKTEAEVFSWLEPTISLCVPLRKSPMPLGVI